MAKITLRSYNREIEVLIDQGNNDQAIAHCRHILSIYNKHINSYRLLGKAYLESQRYGDAADVFQRVLSTVPDDFISHVGMSIIREDEGTLDEAIWHMERAYEVQPANNAIQRELQRLYGQRDGIEPPKIRLTRGALARMYIKGELYQQAINELRAAQAQVSHRPDLFVLLAGADFLAGQKVEAAQVCNQLIKKLPYCLEANRVLADILVERDRAEEAKIYRQRVIALDPYAAHTSPSALTPDEVPDSAITLEKLEWSPDATPVGMLSQPEWASSLGVDIGEDTQDEKVLPEWLSSQQEEPVETEDTSDPVTDLLSTIDGSQPSDGIPDESSTETVPDESFPAWMKDAGWEPSSGVADETQDIFDTEDEDEPAQEELAPADLPDWVQAIAPSESTTEEGLSPVESLSEIGNDDIAEDTGVLPWLEESPPGPTDTVASWLETKEPQLPDEAEMDLEPGEPVEIPEWLQDLKEDKTPTSETTLSPEYDSEKAFEEVTKETDSEDTSEVQEGITVGEAVIGAAAVAAFSVAAGGDSEEPEEGKDETSPESEEEIPEWLQVTGEVKLDEQLEIISEPTTELEAELETPSSEWQPDSAEQPDIESEMIAELQPETQPSDHPKDQLSESEDQQPIVQPEVIEISEEFLSEAVTETEIEEEPSPAHIDVHDEEVEVVADVAEAILEEEKEEIPATLPVDEAQASLEDDESFAWLESLAAKQGVDEAMLLSPEERQESPPEWVQTGDEQVDVEIQPDTEGEVAEVLAEKDTDLPDWLKTVEPSKPETETPAEADKTEIPEWLKDAEIKTTQDFEHPPEPVKAKVKDETMDEIPDWLKGAGAVTGLAAAFATEKETSPEPAETVEPTEIAQPTEITERFIETEKEKPLDEIPLAPVDETIETLDVQPEPGSDILMGTEIPSQPERIDEAAQPQEDLLIDEISLTDEDTKPIHITPKDEVPIPPVPMEIPALETIEATEDDEIATKTFEEELPEWIQDLSKEIELPSDAEAPIEKAEQITEVTGDEISEWLPEITDEGLIDEEPTEGELSAIVVPDEIDKVSVEAEQETQEAVALEDDDAFAWLEGLAAKHGAEEAMLLEPEERPETPPDWVQAATEVKDTSIQPEFTGEVPTEPDEIFEEVAEKVEIEETVEEITESPKLPVEGLVTEIIEDEELTDEVEDLTIVPEIETQAVESRLEEEATEEEVEAEETIPELPPWLAGIEQESEVIETSAWTPTPEITEEEDTQFLPVEEEPSRININEAGLVELERLTGVGFIKAQAIIEYRESNGPFTNSEDLQNVSGIGPSLIEEIEDLIMVELPEEAKALEQPTDENQVTMIQARNALIESNIDQSIENYNKLIQSQQMLPDIIQDLNEALYRFPIDVNIWQTLGDALMRTGQIQEALDAYTKAEELLR